MARALVECMDSAGFPGLVRASEPSAPVTSRGWDVIARLDAPLSTVSDYAEFTARPEDAAVAALFGFADEGSDTADSFGPGCLGDAMRAAYGDSRSWRALERALLAVDERVAADERVVAATQQWASCFNAATQANVASREEAQRKLGDEAAMLLGAQPRPGTVLPGTPGGTGMFGTPGKGRAATAAELAARVQSLGALKTREAAWAHADASCSPDLDAAVERAEEEQLQAVLQREAAALREVGFRA